MCCQFEYRCDVKFIEVETYLCRSGDRDDLKLTFLKYVTGNIFHVSKKILKSSNRLAILSSTIVIADT